MSTCTSTSEWLISLLPVSAHLSALHPPLLGPLFPHPPIWCRFPPACPGLKREYHYFTRPPLALCPLPLSSYLHPLFPTPHYPFPVDTRPGTLASTSHFSNTPPPSLFNNTPPGRWRGHIKSKQLCSGCMSTGDCRYMRPRLLATEAWRSSCLILCRIPTPTTTSATRRS